MTPTAPTKYQFVRNQLEEAIRSGELTTGDQLPAEQALAEQYGVSLMTARKVVCDLVAADLLERRSRQGTFVRAHAVEKVTATTLNLIVVAYDTSFQRTFLNQGVRLTEQQGWRPNVIRLAQGQQDAAVRAIQDGELALLMIEEMQPQSALGLAVRNARDRVISIGLDMTRLGVTSIQVDVLDSFGIAFRHLRSHGHKEIVLLDQNLSPGYYERHSEAWQTVTAGHYSEAEANARGIHLETPRFSCPSFDAYEAVHRLFSGTAPRPTGIISFGEEITQGTLAACRACGLSVPEDVSVVNILDAPSMVFAHPPVTSIDVNFEQQIEVAIDLLKATKQGESRKAELQNVEPLLLERESVAPVKVSHP